MITFLDGAMGTELQQRGLRPGEIPELWNLSRADDVRAVHAAYVTAGADIVNTNTFGANTAKYHGDAPLADVVAAAVANARAAAGANARVALDVGPTGRLLKPAGDFSFAAAYDAFAEEVRLGAAAGADLVAVETISDTRELKAAILAARENCALPVFATVSLGADGKLLTGADVDSLAELFTALRPDACGFNCGLGPVELLPYVRRLAARVNLPVIVKANAGLPQVVDGKTVFKVGPDVFAEAISACVDAGATIVGGCCGTTPDHIRAVVTRLAGRRTETPAAAKTRPAGTRVASGARVISLESGGGLVIGERINPTGKKKLKAAYLAGDTSYILREAVAQTDAGAAILDVNAGVPGIDETQVLAATVEAVQSVTTAPIQIDTSSPAALEAALRAYDGKALVNSVNGKAEVLDAVLPIVAKYGGTVVALTLDENGIPASADGRLAIARKILARGADFGLTKDDFVVDALTLAVSADPDAAKITLETVRRLTDELGVNTVLGVSNVSFGLPDRPALNNAMYTLAKRAGLSAAIANPALIRETDDPAAFDVLLGRDPGCARWIAAHADAVAPTSPAATDSGDAISQLVGAIRHGLKEDAASRAAELLAGGRDALAVIDAGIVPALEEIGRLFETGKIYLPQLLMAAEAASAAFGSVRRALAADGAKPTDARSRRPIVIATVKGDIHDIGKNIVRALLENYGFDVIDLGRDVPPETVVETARKNGCRLVGLSALMTTTLPAMEETIRLLKAADPEIKTFVGGAVLTEDYAKTIGATWYAKDAMASVRIAERFFTRKEKP